MARRTTNVDKPGMRWCPKCEEHRPLEEFGAMASHFDGIDPYCKVHRKEARDASRAKIKAQIDINKRAKTLSDKQLRSTAAEILEGMGYEEVARRLKNEVSSVTVSSRSDNDRGG